MSLLGKMLGANDQELEAERERALIRREAKLGGQLFGPVPAGHRREFFCLDKHTWVWHEEWQASNGQTKIVTTHYNVRPSGIVKTQDGKTYKSLTRSEARNLYRAAGLYRERVHAMYANLLQSA